MKKKIILMSVMIIVSLLLLVNVSNAAELGLSIKADKNINDVAKDGGIIYTITATENLIGGSFRLKFDDTKIKFVKCSTLGVSASYIANDHEIACTFTDSTSDRELKTKSIVFNFTKIADSAEEVELTFTEGKFYHDKMPEEQIIASESLELKDVEWSFVSTAKVSQNDGNNNQTPVPSATGTPVPSATGTPVPSTTGTPVPSTTGTPVPSASTEKKDDSKSDKVLPQAGSSKAGIIALISLGMFVTTTGYIIKRK